MHRLFLLLFTVCVYAGAAHSDQSLDNDLADWQVILDEVSSQLNNKPDDVFLINCVAAVQEQIASIHSVLASGDESDN